MKLLVFINQPPWNELILRSSAYTKSGGIVVNHRGLVLLRTSLRMASELTMWRELFYKDAHPNYGEGMEEADRQAERELKTIPRGSIVGACLLVDCVGAKGGCEYELLDPRRFPKPIPYRKSGPVRFDSIEVSPRIEESLRKVGFWRAAKKAAR